jgi:hypothetical protein
MNKFIDGIWNVNEELSVMPSPLFSLEPIGIGTAYMESLSSYLKRLAKMHHLRVADFVIFCAEQTNETVMMVNAPKLHRIDGLSRSGRDWSQLLADLTRHPDVPYLSMYYWHFLLNPYRLLGQHHAWCPLCYAEFQQESKSCYTPLIWSLQGVSVCLVHRVKLIEVCPHCNRRSTSLTNNAVSGFCPKCQSWLGDANYMGEFVPNEAQSYQYAQIIGQLLALAPHVKDCKKNIVPEVIETLKRNKDIPYTDIQHELRVVTSSLSAMKAGVRSPSLNTLVSLASYSDGLLWFALTKQEQFRPSFMIDVSEETQTLQPQLYLEQLIQSSNQLPALLTIARYCDFVNATALRKAYPVQYKILRQRVRIEQRQALQAILDGDEIMGVSQIARRYGYQQSFLFHFFPELCRQVTRVVNERKRNYCRQKLQEIIASNEFPGIFAICKILGISSYYLKRYFPEELKLIAQLRQQKIQQQTEMARSHLDESITSDAFPPQALEQLAIELGRTTRYLKHNFPIRSQQILQRWQDYKKGQVQATCDLIRKTVFELHQQGIYPSVDRLHATISTWMVHGKVYRDVYNDALIYCGYLVRDI